MPPRQTRSKNDVPETSSATAAASASTTPSVSAEGAAAAAAPKVAKKQTSADAATKVVVNKKTTAAPVAAEEVVSAKPTTVEPEMSAPAASEGSEGAEVSEMTAAIEAYWSKLSEMSGAMAQIRAEFRTLAKKWTRELKVAQKSQAKRKRKSGNRQPSGFTKPVKISDELAKFLNKPAGTEMARTEVTKELNLYIKAHNLKDSANGRIIHADGTLQSLLRLGPGDSLTYFNLQRHISHHFPKSVAAPSAVRTAA